MPKGFVLPYALIICNSFFSFFAVITNLQKSCKNNTKKSLILFTQTHQLLIVDFAPFAQSLCLCLSLSLSVSVEVKQLCVIEHVTKQFVA